MNWRSSSALFHHPRGCGGPWRWDEGSGSSLEQFQSQSCESQEILESSSGMIFQTNLIFPRLPGEKESARAQTGFASLSPSGEFHTGGPGCLKRNFHWSCSCSSAGWRTEIRIFSFGRIHLLSLLWCQHIWAGPGQDQGVFISQFSLPKFPCTLLELCLVPDNDHLMATKAFM